MIRHKKSVKAWIWLALGCFFTIYFLIESLFLDAITFSSLLWCWAVGGVACLVFAFLTFRYGRLPFPKWLFIPCTVILCIMLTLFSVLEFFVISNMGGDRNAKVDYIVVLGAHVKGNKMPSKPLYWRIDAAEKYLNENPSTKAVLSGGQGSNEPISEAQCMYNELVRRGISSDRLILEDKSTDTNQNIRYSLEFIPEDASFAVVSNNFHIFRAVQIAKKISGKEVYGIAADYKDALIIHYAARETVGIFFDIAEGNMTLF